MNSGKDNKNFFLTFSEDFFVNKDILSISDKNFNVQVVKNWNRFNKSKTVEWKKILQQLKVKTKSGLEVKIINL